MSSRSKRGIAAGFGAISIVVAALALFVQARPLAGIPERVTSVEGSLKDFSVWREKHSEDYTDGIGRIRVVETEIKNILTSQRDIIDSQKRIERKLDTLISGFEP